MIWKPWMARRFGSCGADPSRTASVTSELRSEVASTLVCATMPSDFDWSSAHAHLLAIRNTLFHNLSDATDGTLIQLPIVGSQIYPDTRALIRFAQVTLIFKEHEQGPFTECSM